MFLISGSQQFLQSPHLPPCVGAGQVAAFVTTVEVLPQVPAAGWSIMVMDKRIIKFFGQLVKWSLIQASRVGIQCCTLGVNLQTAKIFFRCSRSWTSPASCHLKTLCCATAFELITTAIASTHKGDEMAARRLYCDFIISGNRV